MDIRSHKFLSECVGTINRLVLPTFYAPWIARHQELKEQFLAMRKENERIVGLISHASGVTEAERGIAEIAKKNVVTIDAALLHLEHAKVAIESIQTSGLFHRDPVHDETRSGEFEVNEKERLARRQVVITGSGPRPIFESGRDRNLAGGALGFKGR